MGNGKIRGGTAIYLHDKIETNKICEMSYEKCEMVAIMIPEIQTLNIVIYRPPDTKSSAFNPILNELQRILQTLEKPDPTIILSGDFNLPFVKWKRLSDNSCSWEYKTHTNARTDEKNQFEKLLNICNNQFMLQLIEEPTRKENTLDLVFTNETNLVSTIEVNNSNHSDRNKVEITTNYTTTEYDRNKVKNEEDNIFKSLNFGAKSVNWNNIKEIMEDTNWEQKFENKDLIESGEEFLEILTNNAIENAPKRRKNGNNSKIPKERKNFIID